MARVAGRGLVCDVCDGPVYYGQGPYYPSGCPCLRTHDICDECRRRWRFPRKGRGTRLETCPESDEFQAMLELRGERP